MTVQPMMSEDLLGMHLLLLATERWENSRISRTNRKNGVEEGQEKINPGLESLSS
jgi:hypothetical protein